MAGVMDAIRKAGGLKPLRLEKRHLGVLMVLAYFEDDVTGDCWPCCKTIGQLAGQDHSRVATNRTELERLGYIVEDRERRKDNGKNRKYWLFNEQVFPKVGVANCKMQQVGVANCKMQQELHCTTLHNKEERISKAMDAPFPLVDQDEEEESQEAPAYEPVGTTVAIAPEVPEASSREEEKPFLPEEEKGPTLPVMLHLLDLFKRVLKIPHPRRKEPWPTLEADFEKRYSVEEQTEFLEILDWAFIHAPRDHFRKIFADPNKRDLIRFFINRADDMREDFEANRAKKIASQPLLVNQVEAANSEVVETILPVVVENPPVDIEPTLPLGRLFLQCLQEKGLMFHDTSTWDTIERSLPGKYSAALLLEAPGAIRLVLDGEDAYWYRIMFDGRKANQFAFFMNKLPQIVKSLQASKARGQLTMKTKEPSHGPKKPNKWAGMVAD
jgi:Helix-turn-helix domain